MMAKADGKLGGDERIQERTIHVGSVVDRIGLQSNELT